MTHIVIHTAWPWICSAAHGAHFSTMPASPRKKRAPAKLSPKIPPRGKGSKGSKPSPGGKKQHKPSPKAASSSSKAKPSPKQSASSKDSPAKAKSTSKVAPKAAASGAPAAEYDETDIVVRVSKLMKTNKLSQVQVGQEARVSQAVISQWLARKYHGHNDKVDKAMEDWLVARANVRVPYTTRPAPSGRCLPAGRCRRC
eukprot:COSAG01_NODE_667_length_14389_cov_5.828202_6_plen_199_part_00